MTGLKRSLEDSSLDEDRPSPQDALHSKPKPAASPTASLASTASASSFRNVSACNRCRLRKNRCDQRLPSCASCDKAGVKCVGYDLITKREIPRSYVYYLETRVAYLESLLQENSIAFAPPADFNLTGKTTDTSTVNKDATGALASAGDHNDRQRSTKEGQKEDEARYEREKLTKLVSNIGMVSVQGASDPRFLGSTSGISFARVVFAAVKSSVSGTPSERGSVRGAKNLATSVADGGTSMRDSFFGLHTRPTIQQAPFPDRELALRLVELYFEHANPQLPVLHRGEFMEMFDRVFASGDRHITSRESYMLNIVFAIGAGIIVGGSESADATSDMHTSSSNRGSPNNKKRRLAGQQHQPEEYHASAIVHLEKFLGSSPAADRPDGFGAGLEELQAVLLLAGFALLRPVAPGLWYIVGVAVRLGVDLGLHYEDGVGIDGSGAEDQPTGTEQKEQAAGHSAKVDPKERGRREWVRDLRRRLWWCVYSLDRLVGSCVGRPFGITDEVITTEFPSLLDDKYITKEGFLKPPNGQVKPTYKVITYHYFRLRLLQSEILQVLQHRQAQQARIAHQGNEFMYTKLGSPFLANFDSFRAWRLDVDRRLHEWKESSPSQADAGVQFSPLFLELNYWQAVIMLYRQSLAVPAGLANELGNADGDVGSPSVVGDDEREDEELVFLKVAEAGQKILKLYRQLHRVHLVNYTFLATHHLFMAGISFLYAVWHSVAVRSLLTLDDVDFTVLAATSVLGDLIEKCPPAEACRDAFDRMSKATISMCMSTTGFGQQALQTLPKSYQNRHTTPSHNLAPSSASEHDPRLSQGSGGHQATRQMHHSRRPVPKFDLDLRDLFSEAETDKRSFSRVSNQITMRPPQAVPQVKQEPASVPGFQSDRGSPHFHAQQQQQQQQQQQHQQQQQRQQSFDFNQMAGSPHTAYSPHPQGQYQQHAFSPSNESVMTAAPEQSPLTSTYQMPNSMAYSNNAYPQQEQQQLAGTYPDFSGFSDLEFLDSFPVQSIGDPTAAGLQDFGFGMGGMPLGDGGAHDWSEGGGLDLFEGFFFGPQA
ncbi:hypothetical protein M011DRAFT_465333 [Sporormia fimetaria CBS 119925]|uniref:Zn(2)-C6 fungal-type domain-containing protein n=1 Tax=Sporormia fimetaria CBS 119925 TaxID=1340428 RepID=A0A6A6VKJ9_9PLEO|nr:hypothetical protein M011DRAFT_465333 [Sporormia fimetaria CBS 119925]